MKSYGVCLIIFFKILCGGNWFQQLGGRAAEDSRRATDELCERRCARRRRFLDEIE